MAFSAPIAGSKPGQSMTGKRKSRGFHKPRLSKKLYFALNEKKDNNCLSLKANNISEIRILEGYLTSHSHLEFSKEGLKCGAHETPAYS